MCFSIGLVFAEWEALLYLRTSKPSALKMRMPQSAMCEWSITIGLFLSMPMWAAPYRKVFLEVLERIADSAYIDVVVANSVHLRKAHLSFWYNLIHFVFYLFLFNAKL